MEFSGGVTYGFYGLMSILSLIFVWKMVPETKKKTHEEMEDIWDKRQKTKKFEGETRKAL